MITNKIFPLLKSLLPHLTILTEKKELELYAQDTSRYHALPECVVFPEDHDDVSIITKFCYQHKIPLTTRGRGTATTGAAVPIHGGVVLSIERMNKIIKVDSDNRVMVVQTGVINEDVQNEAKKHGFFWPPDPSSAANCTIGGNLACNAGGPHAIKYGVTRDNTLGLRAVTGTGESIKTGVYTTKGAVGYDLTRLLIGSEGTLAIITEATLKLTPLPEKIITLKAYYKDMTSATRAVVDLMSQPITPSVLEFLDHMSLQMIEKYSGYQHPHDAKAMLIIEVEAIQSSLDEIKNKITKVASNNGLLEIIAADNEEDIKNIWAMRKKLSPALKTVAPKKINEDIVVPVSQIPFFLNEVAKLGEQYHLTIVNFGHAGNGNIHVNIMLDPNDPIQEKNSKIVLEKIFDLVISLNGTLSGEHGVGLDKMPFISKEIDPVSLQLMKQIKHIFDPLNILNPGKIF